jgi:hypothetical protein
MNNLDDFKTKQLEFERVRNAYQEKEAKIGRLLKAKDLSKN